jgi:hypothetical protein
MALPKDRRLYGTAALLGAALYASAAFAWQSDNPFRVRVHQHVFDRAVITQNECKLDVELYFTAPDDGYRSDRRGRNYFLFHARFKFDATHRPSTLVFGNAAAGRRVYRTEFDTSGEGCWAKTEQHLSGVDVEGCRGRHCTPDPFE